MAEARERARKRHDMEAKAAASLPEILRQYKWDVKEIDQRISGKVAHRYLFLENMFKEEDVIWIGEPEYSGNPRDADYFLKRLTWQVEDAMKGIRSHYTCASTFKPGTYSRSNANVLTTPYLITEGDHVLGVDPKTDEQKLANKNACGAVMRWLKEKVGLELCAIVDSGNRSLHGWWKMPEQKVFDELKIILPCLGFDRAMFKPSQPARLAGVIRDNGQEQKLLYIK